MAMGRPFSTAFFQCHSWLPFIFLLQLFSLPFTGKVICEQAYVKGGKDLLGELSIEGCGQKTKGINAPKEEHAWERLSGRSTHGRASSVRKGPEFLAHSSIPSLGPRAVKEARLGIGRAQRPRPL